MFAAVVQKVMEAKTEFYHSITPETYPDELNQSPLPSVSKLHLYVMCEVQRMLAKRKGAVSVDGHRFLDPDKLSYLGSFANWSKYRSVHNFSQTVPKLYLYSNENLHTAYSYTPHRRHNNVKS